MDKRVRHPHGLADQPLLLGAILAVFFWLLDSFMDVWAFHLGSFLERLLPFSDANELWARFEAITILLLLGFFTQLVMRRSWHAEEERRLSEERYRAVVEQAAEGIFFFDANTERIVETNASFQALLGYTANELDRMTLPEIVAHNRNNVVANIQQTLTTHHHILGERDYRRKDGVIVPVEVSATGIVTANRSLLCVVVRDVTERKRAEQAIIDLNRDLERRVIERTAELTDVNQNLHNEMIERARAQEALREREERFRVLIGNVSDIIIVRSSDGITRDVSPSIEGILGYQPDTWLGNDIINFVHPDNIMDVRQFFALLVPTMGIAPSIEVQIRHQDGSWREFEVVANNLLDNPSVRGIVLTFHDITVRKRGEEEILKLNTELAQRVIERTNDFISLSRELGSFSYSVSHDLRAPLRSIDGFSLALLEDYHDHLDPQGRDYLRRVRAASQRMAQLIDAMLDLSRLSRQALRHDHIDLSALATEVAADLQQTQPERAVTWVIAPGLWAEGDEKLVRVVLENLLSNAWKFTRDAAAPRIEVGEETRDGQPVYYVRDNGAGFDMAYADKLFGAFQRLHRASEFEGIGIGLATVQRIVHRHGGWVWAEGAPGRGASFSFTIENGEHNVEYG